MPKFTVISTAHVIERGDGIAVLAYNGLTGTWRLFERIQWIYVDGGFS